MKQRYTKSIFFFLVFATTLCVASLVIWIISARRPTNGVEEITKANKPNILIIFADDVGTDDIPGYWERRNNVRMPNLEKLVTEGTTFTDAHSTPLCAPSRYTLLSGNYPHRGEKDSCVWTLNYDRSQFVPGQQSIAQVLNDNGYQTAMFGKWHIGGE